MVTRGIPLLDVGMWPEYSSYHVLTVMCVCVVLLQEGYFGHIMSIVCISFHIVTLYLLEVHVVGMLSQELL